MTNKTIKYLAFVSAVVAALFSGLHAQTAGGSRETKVRVIPHAKKYLVSDLEPGMPKIRLEKWLRKQVWDKPWIKWKVVACENKAGSKACVELSANSFDMFVGITLEMARKKNSVRGSKSRLKRIVISREDQGIFEVEKLSELSAKLDAVLAM